MLCGDVILVHITRSLYYVYRFCKCGNRDPEKNDFVVSCKRKISISGIQIIKDIKSCVYQ